MTEKKEKCTQCPRMCKADRSIHPGRCGATNDIEVSHYMLHRWEEPPISGYDEKRGSGAVFFTHCPLGCVYCQNQKISRPSSEGQVYTEGELSDLFVKLQCDGAYNINLVSPTQYTDKLITSVKLAKEKGLSIPVVWNTGGYERPETIESLKDTVDIFLTDFKYSSPQLAEELSLAPDYPEYAKKSLAAMYGVTGKPVFTKDETGHDYLTKGVIVRHLLLPSHRDDSVSVLRNIADTVAPDSILLSLMAQFTPEFLPDDGSHKRIRRKITTYEYSIVLREAVKLGFRGFSQERSSATRRFTPDF